MAGHAGWITAEDQPPRTLCNNRAMSNDPDVIDMPLPGKRRRSPASLVIAIVLLLILARIALGIGAEITVKTAFYDGLGMGDVYSKRWHTNVLLGAMGILAAIIFALPMAAVWRVSSKRAGKRTPQNELPVHQWLIERLGAKASGPLKQIGQTRGLPLLAFLVLTAILALSMVGQFVSKRDQLFGFFNATSFGTKDPVFHKDIGFYVFDRPTITGLLGILAGGLVFALITTVIAALVRWLGLVGGGYHRSAQYVAARLRTLVLILAGLLIITIGVAYWYSRYSLVIGGDQLVAGAGKATRNIDIPTRGVAAAVIIFAGLLVIACAVPAVRRTLGGLSRRTALLAIGGVWVVIALVLTLIASPMFLVLLIPAVGAVALGLGRGGVDRSELTRAVPAPAVAVAALISCIALAILGPAAAALNDAVVLRGTRLQVERPNIAATLQATREATGLASAQIVDAPYKRAAVTQAAIDAAPASVGSIRFLDIPPTGEACSRLQTFNQFYSCADVDVDRYTLNGKRRTVFGIGREIDYTKLTDFQRRHFTYTHGYGLVLAPVNEIEGNTGRPVWAAGGIPQRGLTFQDDNGAIYFGAQPDMPWTMVNTRQPVFNRLDSTKAVTWTGKTGITVGSGWRRVAITQYLGGLPYIGGGRKVWNATSGDPADANSSLLIYRDITSRVHEIAPFLTVDEDPYFVAEDGRLFVMAPVYATSDQYPYAVQFKGGVRYLRQSAMAVMDAYSGETHLYVLDEKEPITRAWRSVYPQLFTPGDRLSPALRGHLRLGETGLNVLADATQRFHVTDTDVFNNGDEAWAPTEEAYGPGVQGTSQVSPIRYTYAVLPGDTEERFVAVQSYKPAVSGRGIGFSGWLAVINDPDDAKGAEFGRKVLLRFSNDQAEPLDSLDTFTGNVAKNPSLSSEIGIRKDSVFRGNTIVVPVGKGLLYVQPLYLDSTNDSLPTLWKVIVSFGDGQVFSAPSLGQALDLALGGDGEAVPSSPTEPPTTGTSATLTQLVKRASDEFDAYQKAFGAGKFEEAAKHLKAFRTALAQAKTLADRSGVKP